MITEKEINALARKLYEDILKAYNANPDIRFQDVLNDHLVKYNDDVAGLINKEIETIINSSVGSLSSTVKPLTGVALSSTLYKNSEYVAKQVMKVINENLLIKSTINSMRESIFDGYGYGEILEIAKDAKLPKYLLSNLTEARIKKLKTKSLAAGYFEVLDAKTDKALKKALYVASQEKSRYYAYRIAATEEQRAFNQSLVSEYLEEGVEYVKVTLSPSHKTVCVCDYYANMNIGYGAGVFPLRQAVLPPYHPYCKCKLTPIDNMRKWNVANPGESALEKFTKTQQRVIKSALRSKWSKPTVGQLF